MCVDILMKGIYLLIYFDCKVVVYVVGYRGVKVI